MIVRVIKATFLCGLLMCLHFAATPAQTPSPSSDPPDLSVLKYSWTKERIGWEKDPFSGTNDSFDDMRRRVADDRRKERAQATGNIAEANKIEQQARAEQVLKARPPAPPRYAFLYKISIKNSGPKTIKELDWDYVFFDAVTKQEIGRRQFTSSDKIGSGKSKDLSFLIPSAPAKTISVYALDKNERANLQEQVVLVRVQYDDGSVWIRP